MPQDIKPWWRFDECGTCQNRRKPRTCGACDNGEYFTEDDPEGMDGILKFKLYAGETTLTRKS
jgi:hypothetical protein